MNSKTVRDDGRIEKQSVLGYNNFFGLFVGIEEFHDKNINHLYGSVEDAIELAQAFDDNVNLIQKKITVCTNQAATREQILEKLLEYINEAKANDLLLFYISTHGLVTYNDYYFFPHDCKQKNILGTGISASTFTNALHSASKTGVKVLVILDTCHSGAIGFDLSKFKGEYACLLSSSPVEYSYETFNIERSIFTYHLTEILRNPPSEGLKLIDVFNQVYTKVQKQTQKKQNPLLIGTMNNQTILLT